MTMRIAAEWIGVPLYIDGGKAAAIAEAFGARVLGDAVTIEGVAAVDHWVGRQRMGVVGEGLTAAVLRSQQSPLPIVDGVGVIPIEGTLVRKGLFLGQSSGETSYQGVTALVERARRDPAVKGVAIEVDSFGGHANGITDLADRLARLSAEKPTIAILTDFALSAGYFLASQARQIVMPAMGAAGSIGSVIYHIDESRALDMKGLTVTAIQSGARKTEGDGNGPLPDGLRQEMQARADAGRDIFAAYVAAGRGRRMTKAMALATEAAVFHGEAAVDAGLVDAIGDPHQAFAAFVRAVNS